MRFTRAFSAALVAALFAAGCSGGGGGGGGGNGGEPPIADAGDDADARLYQPYTLVGSFSTDPEGKDLTYAWTVLSAPDGSAATLTSGGAAANVAFTPDREGAYLFGLVVSDGKKSSALDTVEVDVELRIAVFADRFGDVATELTLAGAGRTSDFYGWPDSHLAAATGEIAVFEDFRTREQTLLAYHSNDGSQEQLVTGIEIDSIRAGGDYVVWRELRGGQYDLFQRNLVTGEEIQITNDEDLELVGEMSADHVTFLKQNPPYGVDAFVYDFASHGIVNVSDMDPVDEYGVFTDGDTVVYTSSEATQDVWAYEVATQTRVPVAVNTTDQEVAYGVSGDFVVMQISTGGNPSIYRQRLSNGQRVAIAPEFSSVLAVQGDYVLYYDGALEAHRLSTGATSTVTTSFDRVSLRDGVVAWTEFNGATYDVKTRALPAGAVTTIANGGDAYGVQVLSSGIAWDSHPGTYVYDVYFSADGGATQDLASDGKTYLTAVLADYDVAIVGPDIDSSFGDDTIDALLAAGVPVLSLDRDGSAVASHFGSQAAYGLSTDAADCGANAVRFSNSTHPAFAGFPAGGYTVLERELPVSYESRALIIDDLAPPPGWTPLASFDLSSGCFVDEGTAIATFTTSEGTQVILDGAATDFVAVWESARRELVISELRYLASTRAP